jgi:hypothetical protein
MKPSLFVFWVDPFVRERTRPLHCACDTLSSFATRPREFFSAPPLGPRANAPVPIKDSLIAATALVHGLAVVTRDREDFEKSGAVVIDPFSD